MIHLGGGSNAYGIYLTGTEDTVSTLSSNPTAATPTVTNSVTASSQTDNSSQSNKSSGPNIAGIAAGVVVGAVVLCIIIGAALFLIRRHKRSEVSS